MPRQLWNGANWGLKRMPSSSYSIPFLVIVLRQKHSFTRFNILIHSLITISKLNFTCTLHAFFSFKRVLFGWFASVGGGLEQGSWGCFFLFSIMGHDLFKLNFSRMHLDNDFYNCFFYFFFLKNKTKFHCFAFTAYKKSVNIQSRGCFKNLNLWEIISPPWKKIFRISKAQLTFKIDKIICFKPVISVRNFENILIKMIKMQNFRNRFV